MATWTRVVRATSASHSGESAAAAAMRVLTRFMSAATICDRAAKAAQTVAVASQAAAAIHSATAALALIEASQGHVEAAHAQLMEITAQIEISFSDNGRQPTTEELAIAESV